MALEVKLEVFEGPLDLLLHLIEKNKVDIYDIPIVTITEQYLDYIKQMEREDMNVMSEFLVMAPTLLDIKCISSVISFHESSLISTFANIYISSAKLHIIGSLHNFTITLIIESICKRLGKTGWHVLNNHNRIWNIFRK